MKLTQKRKKVALIIISAGAGLIMAVLLFAYLYIHSMIAKINIVDDAKSNMVEAAEEQYKSYLSDNMQEEASGSMQADAGGIPDNEDDLLQETDDSDILFQAAGNRLPDASGDEIAELEKKIRDNLAYSEIKDDKDVLNILLIGSDSRKSGKRGRSDAMILISINKKTKTITATSILRDIYLKIPGRDEGNRINAAFAFGGAGLLLDTIRQNFRINVDKYVIIDFYAFIDMVDATGGVTVEVGREDIPVINGYVKELNRLTGKEEYLDCIKEAGTLQLNGKQALGYLRNRYIGSDFTRTAKQREVLKQVFDRVKKLKISAITELADRILPQITTNLTEGEIFSLILALPSYIRYDIKQGGIPVRDSYKDIKIRGMAVLAIDFEKNISFLHESIYGKD